MRLIRLRSVVRHFATGEALCTVGEANERQRNEWQSRLRGCIIQTMAGTHN